MIEYQSNIIGQFKKAHKEDAGYDIVADEDTVVPALSSVKVSTGLKVSIPEGWVGILKSRSGLACNHSIEVGAGVIDSGYTGEIKVLLHNSTNEWYEVKKGHKIAQMVVLPIWNGKVRQVYSLEEETERGDNGFNSTGY